MNVRHSICAAGLFTVIASLIGCGPTTPIPPPASTSPAATQGSAGPCAPVASLPFNQTLAVNSQSCLGPAGPGAVPQITIANITLQGLLTGTVQPSVELAIRDFMLQWNGSLETCGSASAPAAPLPNVQCPLIKYSASIDTVNRCIAKSAVVVGESCHSPDPNMNTLVSQSWFVAAVLHPYLDRIALPNALTCPPPVSQMVEGSGRCADWAIIQ